MNDLDNSLSVQVRMIDPDDLPDDIRKKLNDSPDHFIIDSAVLYLLMNQSVLCCPDTQAGRELVFMIRSQHAFSMTPKNPSELMYNILTDTGFGPESGAIPSSNLIRCVILFRAFSLAESDFFSLFHSMVPLDRDDVPVSIDYRTVALVKAVKDQTDEDIAEYASAVIGTFSDEGYPEIRAGIGHHVSLITDLRNSYLEAAAALQLGLRFHPDDMVYHYSRQTLERIIDSISPEKRLLFRKELFRGDQARKLPEEVMTTVREFFRNDLNMTATSKQLFIHRNTLNYRLDKIRKEYGLDLRKFQDAVVFKILSEIPEK